jgi:deoxycytidine triphosphate deaminase
MTVEFTDVHVAEVAHPAEQPADFSRERVRNAFARVSLQSPQKFLSDHRVLYPVVTQESVQLPENAYGICFIRRHPAWRLLRIYSGVFPGP